jgi:hypothetical protein
VPEVSLRIDVSPEVFEQLTDLGGQITTLVGAAQEDLDKILAAEDTSNALSGLLAELSSLAETAGQLPVIDDLLGGARDLVAGLPDVAPFDVGDIEAAIEAALGVFGPVRELLDGAGFEQLLETGLERGLDIAGSLSRQNEALGEIAAELEEFFRLFRFMLGWEGSAPAPEEVAKLLSQALAGVPLDLLDAPAAALEAALAPVGRLLPEGSDLTRWRDAKNAQLAFWTQLDARLAAGGAIDWPRLEADLRAARVELLELVATRERLLAIVIANLNAFRLPQLDSVATALAGLPRIPLQSATEIFVGLRRQLTGVVDELERFDPTPEELRQLIAGAVATIVQFFEGGPLGHLRGLLVNFEQRVLAAIDKLPLRDIALEMSKLLRDLAATLDVVDPDTIRKPLSDFFDEIKRRVDDVSGEAVSNSIGEVWDKVEGTVGDAAELLETMRATLDGLLATLQKFSKDVKGSVDPIVASLTTLSLSLQGFDLREGADEVIETLHGLRDTVASIDVSHLPEPAVAAVKQAADALRDVDVAGTVREPLDEVLETIDPTPLLTEISGSLEAALEPLGALDPSALAGDLDAPIDELLATLARFDPAQLETAIQEALEPITVPLRELDFADLLAPLTQLYAELVGKVDAALDPEPLLRPLEELYQPVLDVVDAINPTRLLELIEPHGEGIGTTLGKAAEPPAHVTAQGPLLKEAMASTRVDVDDELFGFRPGDLLIPLIDLHEKLMSAFEALDDAVLEPAASLLQELLHGRLESLDPAAVLARLDAADAEIELELGAAAVSGALADAALAYSSACRRVAAAASGELSVTDRAVTARVTLSLPDLDPLRLVPTVQQSDALFAARLRLDAGPGLTSLRHAFPSASETIAAALPDFLADGDLGAGALRAALQALDPAPIRDEVNALFDAAGKRLVALEPTLFTVLDEVFLTVEEFLLPVSPSNLFTLAERLHTAVREQVDAVGPASFKDELAFVFDTVKAQLEAFDPAILVTELDELRDGLLESLETLIKGLLPDPAPLHELQARLAALKPSRLLASVAAAAEPLTKLVAELDPDTLFGPIIEAIATIRAELPDVIADIEVAFDEVLDAFPEGGVTGAGVSVSVSASVG